MRSILLGLTVLPAALVSLTATAADFPYRRNVSVSVGESIVLKGVRSGDCSETAPKWSQISGKLPKPKLGSLSDGGPGTVQSNSCGGRVGARGVRFTAKTKGTEQFVVYDDAISVTVR